MIVSHIGNRAMSLYITEPELRARNLTVERLGRDEALDLLKTALHENRLDGWEAAELALFSGREGVLLFARRKSGLPRHFFFSDFELLLHAVHSASDTLPSVLSRTSGGYVLTVYPFEGDQPPAVLYEFGRDLGQCTYLEAHLAEQGDVLIPSAAMGSLRMHFVR